jgi:RND family efflux transporter MFP subunit
MDPQRGGRVQAMIAGRLEAAGANGLPATGSRVKKGDVLAWVVPAEGQIERAGQAALLAELQASRQLAEKRLARLQELADTVPGKEIDAAASEVASLKARAAAISHGVSGRDALVAPVSGVIAAANAVVGQVVDSRELVFEIIDPDSLHVEALAYETLAPGEVVSASLAVGVLDKATQAIPLNFIGAGSRLREQALPLIFGQRGRDVGLLLPLGQPVKIHVLLRSTAKGLPIPQQALVRSPANEPMVWVKSSPERFTPKTVRSQPLDGARVLITGGLADGDRVVTDGATLINQIR